MAFSGELWLGLAHCLSFLQGERKALLSLSMEHNQCPSSELLTQSCEEWWWSGGRGEGGEEEEGGGS